MHLMIRAAIRFCLVALLLSACSGGPTGREVVAQAQPDGAISFDVVKIDDAVVRTLLAQHRPSFADRFKKYPARPSLKIGIGDTLAVVIFEGAGNGLFGQSLPIEGSLSAAQHGVGASARQGVVGLAPQQGLHRGASSGAAPGIATGSPNLQTGQEAAAQSRGAGTLVPDQLVGPDGGISIPYAGRIIAAGKTPEEVQRVIEQRLADKAIAPQALVTVRHNLANSVSVVGEAVGGARVPLSPGGERLLEVLAATGGSPQTTYETFVQLSRGGISATVPYSTLIDQPDQNIFAEPDDVLTVLHRPQTFTVLGATGKNAAIEFNAEKLSLGEALAKAGGLNDDRADPAAVFLFRYEPIRIVRALGQPAATDAPAGWSPIAYRLDLGDAKSLLLAREFPVHDRDIIFVGGAESHNLNQAFTALSLIVGPILTGIVTCTAVAC